MPTRLAVPKGSSPALSGLESFLLLRLVGLVLAVLVPPIPLSREEAVEVGDVPDEPPERPWRVLSFASSWAMRCWRICVLLRALPLSYEHSVSLPARTHCWQAGFPASHLSLRLRQLRLGGRRGVRRLI